MTSFRYLIIHGHFYQPPRENPWSGTIGLQPSAAPFPDWNARITRECYAPNAVARLLDNQGAISKIINNFEYLSFNIGPTLLMWLKDYDVRTFNLIKEADARGAQRHRSHGPAMAQVFNHIIMPLANSRDKQTQVLWGRAHFEKTFGRPPEGMWLAETAADSESLGLMAKAGLKFTVLAQSQIDALRPLANGRDGGWTVLESPPDPRQPYRLFWGKGQNDFIDAFVYDGPVSRAVAFENLLRDGAAFLDRLTQAFGSSGSDSPRLVNTATDGESYGHHFHFGDMTLAWLFNAVESQPPSEPNPIKLTNYGEYLAQYPPVLEGRLVENSSWSCAHGLERWRSDCGCHTGGGPGWNQKWRTPLRDGLNWLRDELKNIYLTAGARLLHDPWAARDDYINVVLEDYRPEAQDAFLARQAKGSPGETERKEIFSLMESQLMSLYMFTSCGWFFDDLAGLEPVQNLRYALRAVELAGRWAGSDLAEGLVSHLRKAKPNDPDYPTGEDVWKKQVLPASLKPEQAAAHLAASQILEIPEVSAEFPLLHQTFSTEIREKGPEKLLTGQVTIKDIRLGQGEPFRFAALLSEGRELDILVDKNLAAEEFTKISRFWDEGGGRSLRANLGTIKPGAQVLTPEELWPSVRQTIMTEQVRDFFEDLLSYTRKSFENYRQLLGRYRRPDTPVNWMDRFIFRVMAETDLEKFTLTMTQGGPVDLDNLAGLLDRESADREAINADLIKKAAADYLLKLLSGLTDPSRPDILSELLKLTLLLKKYPDTTNIWSSQNRWYELWNNVAYVQTLTSAELALFIKIGESLGFGPAVL
ncbi:MAG: DUF3536 domain-containing protein [Deltaproteobacteria bacterium]|nr:DUF3536 domain-containing protein [Deltaproteobacteria bacterium]